MQGENMAYKVKTPIKDKMKYSEKQEYYLVDFKKGTYDPHLLKGWKGAVHLNMVYQMTSDNPNVVPMEKEWVLKNKPKQEKFLAK
jgi:hypothetical protein